MFKWDNNKTARLISQAYGAGDEARTRYLNLGKVALYQMSYTRIRFFERLYIITDRYPFVNTFFKKNCVFQKGKTQLILF